LACREGDDVVSLRPYNGRGTTAALMGRLGGAGAVVTCGDKEGAWMKWFGKIVGWVAGYVA